MIFIKRSHRSKIVFIFLGLMIVEKGWVREAYPSEAFVAAKITAELIYALSFAGSVIYRACINAHDSAVDKVFQQEISRLTGNAPTCPDKPSTSPAQVPQMPLPVQQYTQAMPVAQATVPATVKEI